MTKPLDSEKIKEQYKQTPSHLRYRKDIRTGRTLVYVGIALVILGYLWEPLITLVGLGLIGGGILRYAYGRHKNSAAMEKFEAERFEQSERDQAQDTTCDICGKESNTLRLDHDPHTKEARGLLCGDCNTGIRLLGDDIEGLTRAMDYLSKS